MKKKIFSMMLVVILSYGFSGKALASNEVLVGKLIGEGARSGNNLLLLSCTVRNRLDKGWTPQNVANQYYAQYVEPTLPEIEFVEFILNSESNVCPPVYFAYSDSDISRFNPNVIPLFSDSGINYYEYKQYTELIK